MEDKYLTRKDILARGAFWDLAKVQNFAHDLVRKSESGRGRPSYLYLLTRVEAFERGESVPSEFVGALPTPKGKAIDLEDRLDKALASADKASSAPSIHASVFNEGTRIVSRVPPAIITAIRENAPRHAPILVPPTPRGVKPHITLITVDDDGKESIVATPIVVD